MPIQSDINILVFGTEMIPPSCDNTKIPRNVFTYIYGGTSNTRPLYKNPP